MYDTDLRSEVSQGDIFQSIRVVRIKYPEMIPVVKDIQGILLTDDCEYDKKRSVYVLVCEVRLLAEVSPGSAGNIKNYKTLNTFYLEGNEKFKDSYLDLSLTYQVEKQFLIDLANKGLRIKSLSDTTRSALQRQISIYFGYKRNPEAVTETTSGESVEAVSN